MFPSHEYSGLDQIVSKFVDSSNLRPDSACFGVAGPVRNGRVEASNLPWVIDSKRLADELKLKNALLINDLEANAWGIAALAPQDLVALNQVKGTPMGNQAVISAGTGLGEAGMYWDGKRHHIFASEGGHSDFSPRNELEIDLFRYLSARYGHVSYERIISGPGLVNVFHFLRDTGRGTEPQWLTDEMSHADTAAGSAHAPPPASTTAAATGVIRRPAHIANLPVAHLQVTAPGLRAHTARTNDNASKVALSKPLTATPVAHRR